MSTRTKDTESMRRPSMSRLLPNLEGAHVRVVTDYISNPPVFSVEIFARVFLTPSQAALVEKHLGDAKPSEARQVLDQAGADPKFLAMFDAVLPFVAKLRKGTGGIPNELSIRDFGGEAIDQRSFVVHTEVFLNDATAKETAELLGTQLGGRQIDDALQTLNDNGEVMDSGHLEAMLRAAMG